MNRQEAHAAALDQFDRHMIEAVGHTHEQYAYIRAAGTTSLDHVKLYGDLVDESGIVELVQKWDAEDRKSAAGRKPQMDFRAVLILFIMHIDAGDARYNTIARTLFARTTPEVREYLGYANLTGNQRQWYTRYRRSLKRVLELCEPWQVSGKHLLTAEEFATARASYSQVKRDRMEELINTLIAASVKRLPADIRARYAGNVAIDGTTLKLVGRANPGWTKDKQRYNLDAMSGPYTRTGKHKGDGRRTDEPGWEFETVVTVPNRPGEPMSFPVLTTGVAVHQPGRNKYGPLIAMRFHTRLFAERGKLIGDQAYNGHKVERFQLEIRKMGFRTVWNYGKKTWGLKAAIEDAILVDGCLYLKWMPANLITATDDYRNDRIDGDKYRSLVAARSKYRLKEKGKPDTDGFQRFSYPVITRDMMLYDPATGKRLRKNPVTKVTLTVGPNTDEGRAVIKHLQCIEFATEQWHAWFGLRNRVEENNQHFKSDGATDIGNPEKRRARGYAYNALAGGAAIAVSNIRRIVTFIEAEAQSTVGKSTLRERRRTDIDGKPLQRELAA